MGRLGNHILFWIGYVLFKTYLNISANWPALLPNSASDISKYANLLGIQFIFLFIKVPLVYSCFYIIDKYLQRKLRITLAIGSILMLFGVSVVLMNVLNLFLILPYLTNLTPSLLSIFNYSSLLSYFFTLIFVTGIATTFKLLRSQQDSKIREAELQKEKTETELKYLRSQINPHFLFNTLNNIYSLARKQSDQTADAVLKLSELMRFMLYESGNQTIFITDELKFIKDYLELEKLRYSDRLITIYNESIDDPYQKIAPLILIHFVENAFKNGSSESRFNSMIIIDVTLKDKVLVASFVNSKGDGYDSIGPNPINLESIKRLLGLVYPQHQLSVADDVDRFKVDLTIKLNNGI